MILGGGGGGGGGGDGMLRKTFWQKSCCSQFNDQVGVLNSLAMDSLANFLSSFPELIALMLYVPVDKFSVRMFAQVKTVLSRG